MSKYLLKNKTLVYVGGLGGIGLASCKAFLAKGISVSLETSSRKSYSIQTFRIYTW